MSNLSSIDFDLSNRLSDAGFRREWFRAQLEYGVPEQFRALREARGMTQTALAEKAGMKQSAISRFEKSSDANWNLETLVVMADALDAQLEVRLTRSEDVIFRVRLNERLNAHSTSVMSGQQAPRSWQEPGGLLAAVAERKDAPTQDFSKGSLLWKLSNSTAQA